MKTKIAHKELANARYNQMRQNMPSVLSSWQERILDNMERDVFVASVLYPKKD